MALIVKSRRASASSIGMSGSACRSRPGIDVVSVVCRREGMEMSTGSPWSLNTAKALPTNWTEYCSDSKV